MTTDRDRALDIAPVASPVELRQRIALLDILRGFALLGILMLNIDGFAGPESSTFHDIPVGLAHPAFTGWHATLDYAIVAVKWTFFEGKMRALFAMLFGASTILLLERIGRRQGEGRAADIFHRRNMWLVGIGLLHGLFIWSGDILTQYGLFALVLLYPLRNIAPRKLLAAGLSIWLIGGSVGSSVFLDIPGTVAKEQVLASARTATAAGIAVDSPARAVLDEADADAAAAPSRMTKALEKGRAGFVQSGPATRAGFLGFFGAVVTSGLMLEVIGAMVTGMGLFRIGFFSGRLSSRTYMTLAAASYAVALPLGLGGLWYSAQHDLSVTSVLESLFYPYMALQFTAALGNASVVILVVKKGWMSPLTRSLAAVGRTALSSYLFTSLLCRFVFSWGPWKLYGELEYYQYLYVVAAVWILNVVSSRTWLHFFAFGPVEWLWRSLTYWKVQPMRNDSTSRATDGA